MSSTRSKSLIKNTFIISIGIICTKMVTFLLLPLYTSLLSTEEYGILDLLSVLITLLIPIVTFQVEQAVFRNLIEIRSSLTEKKKTISSAFFSVAIQCCIFIFLYLIICEYINNDYKLLLLSNIIFTIFSSLFLQIARGLGKNINYSIGSFFNALITIAFNVICLVCFHMKVEAILIGMILGNSICIIYLFFSLHLYKYICINNYDKGKVKRLWKYSIPLIPNAISWWVFSSSDRIIVTTILGLSMNGILSAATKFSNIYITLYNIFDASWTENISIHIDDADIQNYFSKMFNTILKFFFSLAILILAVMPVVFPLMINSRYHYGYNLIPILIMGSLFNIIVGLLSVIYIAKKNTKTIATTSIVSAVFNIIIHLCLIKHIGLYAAAISTLASYFILSIYRLIDINKKYFRININYKIFLFLLFLTAIVLIVYYYNSFIFTVITIIVSVLLVVYINRESISNIFIILKQKLQGGKN